MDNDRDPYAKRDIAPIDLTQYFRGVGLVVAIVLVVSGLYLTFEAFRFVQNIVTDPEVLVAQLDRWVSVEEPQEPPAAQESPTESAEVESMPEGGVEKALEEIPPQVPLEVDFGSAAPEQHEMSWPEAATYLVEALKSGGLARALAAVVIFLFATLLVKIPIQLITAGTKLLTYKAEN